MWKATTPLNTPNETGNFYPADGNWELKQLPLKASIVMEGGSAMEIEIVSNTTTGNITKMVGENVLGADFVGILAEPIATTDEDYATSGKLKAVRVPSTPKAEAYFTVGAGTFSLADVFKTVEVHTDSVSLAVDTAGKGARITGYISSTKGTCNFSLPTSETA